MTDYTKITDYAAKDSMLIGDPGKKTKGSEVGADFDAVAVAVATKVDKNGALGTPSSGTLTNCTGLPQAGTVGLTTSDSPQFTALNVGHASDTTLTRASAGTLAVEGINLLTTATGVTQSSLSASSGSSLIGHISTGTGAIATTAQAKLREFVSIKDFGAIGDGVTDDTAAIQASLDAVHSGGYGGVYAPAGIYLTGEINWPGNNITLRGAGSGYSYNSSFTPRTIFKAKAGTTIVFDLVQTGAAEDRTGNHLVDLKIDGNSIASYGIKCAGANIVERVSITGCVGGGLYLTNFTNSTHIKSCAFIANSGYGLYVDGSSTTAYSIEDTNMALNTLGGAYIGAGVVCDFRRCVFESNTGSGLIIYKANAHTGSFNALSFDGCWFEDNASTGDYAINISAQTVDEAHAPDHIEFCNCRISASVSTRKYLYAPCCKDVSFINCQFDTSTQSDAVFFSAQSRRVSFIECANGVATGITATQMDNAIAQGTNCWWHDGKTKRVVGAGSPAASFENSWVNFGGGYANAKYWFTRDGDVCIEGLVKNGSAANATIFTLPVGYRPAGNHIFSVDANASYSRALISTTGAITIHSGGSTTAQSLSGIFFQTNVA